MNKVIIIGNGFDLAHGLKTSYEDFMINYFVSAIRYSLDHSTKYTDANMTLFVVSTFKLQLPTNLHFILSLIRRRTDSQIDDFVERRQSYFFGEENSHTIFISIKNSFLFEELLKSNIYHWMDFEYRYFLNLLKISNEFREDRQDANIRRLQTEFNLIKQLLCDYIKSLKSPTSNPIIASRILVYHSSLHDVIMNKYEGHVLFLNFNYTETIKQYLAPQFKNFTVLNIHGDLHNNEIVFGYGDENGSDYHAIENLNCNLFFENVKSFYYLKNDMHQKLMTFIENDLFEIEIWGHSCSISDRTLLKRILEDKNCVTVKIFYHRISDTQTNYMEVSQNLSRHFSDKYTFRTKVINELNCTNLL